MTPMVGTGVVGKLLRSVLIKPEREWLIPFGPSLGLRLEVDPRAPLHKYLGTSEVELIPWIRRFARRGYRCFDVGGHDAHDALMLARRTRGEVITFEFDDVCVARMRRNLSLNPKLAERVRVVETYIAHECNAFPRTDTLDALIAGGQTFIPDFIKVDVEGAEATVLSGAQAALSARRPHVLVETHSSSLEAECIAILRQVGYDPIVVGQRRWLRENRGSVHNRWLAAKGIERECAAIGSESPSAGALSLGS